MLILDAGLVGATIGTGNRFSAGSATTRDECAICLQSTLDRGTGGNLSYWMLRHASFTGSSIPVSVISGQTDGENSPIGMPQMLATIKMVFSLNVTEMASLLGVERPTIYSWQREDSEPRNRHVERARALHAAAVEAGERIGRGLPRRALRISSGGVSIISLLEEPDVDPKRVAQVAQLVAERENGRADAISKEATGPDTLALMAELGIEADELESQSNFDVVTGKRITEE